MMRKTLKKHLRRLTLADYFSLYRFIAFPVLIGCTILQLRTLTGILLLISFLTDIIDGFIARKKNIESARGAKLDSIGDLLTLLAGFTAFIMYETAFFLEHKWIIIVSVSLFMIQMIMALIRFGKVTSFHTWSAKITAVLLGAFLVTTLLFQPYSFLFYIAFSMAIAEALEEIVLVFLVNGPNDDVKGLYWLIRDKMQAGPGR